MESNIDKMESEIFNLKEENNSHFFKLNETNNFNEINKIDEINEINGNNRNNRNNGINGNKGNIGNIEISEISEINENDNLENNNKKIKNLEIFTNVKMILSSMMRTKLLICLFSGKKDLKAIRDELEKPSTSILHGIKELDKLRLVKKEGKLYDLSSNGTILAMNIVRLIENLNSINNNIDFWKYHSIADIPKNSLKNIHLLQNATAISATEKDLAKTSNEYVNLFSKSKNVKILLPIFSSTHLNAIFDCLNRGGNLELIVTENILEFIKMNKYRDKFLSYIKEEGCNNSLNDLKNDNHKNNNNYNNYKNYDDGNYNNYNGILKIWKFSSDFKLFLSSCDNFLSLSSFSEDGYYDNSSMLLDKTINGIIWGNEVFNHYKEYSEEINIKEYFSDI